MADTKKDLVCSFCSKPRQSVQKLIAGETALICNECIDLSSRILAEQNKKDIVNFSKELNFTKDPLGRWPGTRSDYLHLINNDFFVYVITKIISILYPIEYKNMKNITESLRKKLSDKTKKSDVISENFYKVAGNFYNENYNQFFKKFEKLTENYKKSKLFLNEDSSENFNRAITKVFKGDEERLRDEAIPFFMNK